MWEKVALECLVQIKGWCRPGVACKAKFEKMAFALKPTGQTEIPLYTKRAKDVKDKIAQNEVIGYVHANDEPVSSELTDDVSDMDNLKCASLLDLTDEKSVRRPKTNAQKSKDLSEAIAQVGKDNLAGTNLLTAAIQDMAGALSGANQNDPDSEMTKLKIEECHI